MSRLEYFALVLSVLAGSMLTIAFGVWVLLGTVARMIDVAWLETAVVRLVVVGFVVLALLAHYLPGLLTGREESRRRAQEHGLLTQDDGGGDWRRPA